MLSFQTAAIYAEIELNYLIIFAHPRQRNAHLRRQDTMKAFFTFAILCISMVSRGQSDYDERLLARYSEDRLQELSEKKPSIVEYWTYYLDHSYTIVDGETSGKVLSTDEEIKIKNLKEFNILKLDIHMDRNRPKAYRIQGTNQFLILKSNDQFSKEFSRNRSSTLK